MKNIIVIGAGKGIGLEVVQQLRAEGNNVFAITRSESAELAATGAVVLIQQIGKNDIENVEHLPEEIHGLVYCPGSIMLKPFNRFTKEDFQADFEQNVLGAVNAIQTFLPKMKKSRDCSIVLYSTVATKVGMPFHASIAASKGAIEGLGRSLAAELAASNIRVNVIAPSLTDTPLASALLNTPEKQDAAAKRHPLKRVGSTQDMASLTTFLLSDNATWITGQVIGVDGGMGSLKV